MMGHEKPHPKKRLVAQFASARKLPYKISAGELQKFDAARYLDNPESVATYLVDILQTNDSDVIEAALGSIASRATIALIRLDLTSEAGRRLVLEAAKRVIAKHADVLARRARR